MQALTPYRTWLDTATLPEALAVFLNAMSGRELLEEDAGVEALCRALVEKFSRHPALDATRQQFEALKRKTYGELIVEEKQRLLMLTQ